MNRASTPASPAPSRHPHAIAASSVSTGSSAPGASAPTASVGTPGSLEAIAATFVGPDEADLASIAPLSGGLINDTYAVGSGWVLQRLHPIFAATVNLDIAALTPTLRDRGVPVPSIAPSQGGEPWTTVAAGPHAGVWRLLSRLPGHSVVRVASPQHAASAARLVATFHAALLGIDHRFAFSRPGAHDTEAHVAGLRQALAERTGHRLHAEVAALAQTIEQLWAAMPPLPPLPARIVHGDLKIANLLFDDTGAAIGIVDLDTMAWSTIDVELGDAMRSWCNRSAEDEPARLDLDIFAAAMRGYAAGGRLDAAERAAVVHGFGRIALELSARFAKDALVESYFRWDPKRAAGHGEHNLMRARGQLGLAQAVANQVGALHALVEAAFAESVG